MTATRPLVIVVEDERQIRSFVRAALEDDGCRVEEAATAAEGLERAGALKPALIMLDLGLPDRDGVDFIRDLRIWSAVPVIVLSARSAESEKIEALDAGADDYLAKPFGVGELLARVRAVLRRRPPPGDDGSPFYEFGNIKVDHVRRVIERAGQPVHLTPIEYRLLSLLIANVGKVQTHRQLLKQVWGPAYVESTHYLRVYVGNLRQKLEDDPTRPQHFLTEAGVGYRFQP
jgi:two-component system KDP operon response regulator KdpE